MMFVCRVDVLCSNFMFCIEVSLVVRWKGVGRVGYCSCMWLFLVCIMLILRLCWNWIVLFLLMVCKNVSVL